MRYCGFGFGVVPCGEQKRTSRGFQRTDFAGFLLEFVVCPRGRPVLPGGGRVEIPVPVRGRGSPRDCRPCWAPRVVRVWAAPRRALDQFLRSACSSLQRRTPAARRCRANRRPPPAQAARAAKRRVAATHHTTQPATKQFRGSDPRPLLPPAMQCPDTGESARDANAPEDRRGENRRRGRPTAMWVFRRFLGRDRELANGFCAGPPKLHATARQRTCALAYRPARCSGSSTRVAGIDRASACGRRQRSPPPSPGRPS